MSGQSAKTVAYNAQGNITSKSDVGSYSYSASRPHAVISAGGVSYSYDANGNNISSSDGRAITYTTFDQAQTVSKGGHTTTFAYGPDRQRYKRIDTKSGNTRTTLYIGSVEKITEANGTKKVKRHIGGVMIETESYTSGGSLTGEEKHYVYKDHLGSTDVITDHTGTILTNGGELSFDAWGQRRSGVNWSDVNVATLIANYGVFASVAPPTTRGFTGHEMVDDVGIIHMNGRIYDPRLGRFLQADPFVQSPTDTQSYNRYSYVGNNPLNATDPSGYFSLREWVGVAVAIIGTIICQGNIQCGAPGYALVGAASGAAAAAANGGNILQGAVIGAFTAMAFYGVGEYFTNLGGVQGAVAEGWNVGALKEVFGTSFQGFGLTAGQAVAKIALHGLVGGVMSVVSGGKFGHGFASAGLTQAASGPIGRIGSNPVRAVAAGIVGGTASEITGGKFANGAITGAFSQLFNDQAHELEEERAWGSYLPGTAAGDSAAQYWADRLVAAGGGFTDDPVAATGLFFSVLWTDETAANTTFTLGTAGLSALHAARPFWQYYPAGNNAYSSTWVTRGLGWKPPYARGSEAASRLALPAYNPATAVKSVNIPWYQFVRGPRIVAPQPTFGTHATGGGIEYRLMPLGK